MISRFGRTGMKMGAACALRVFLLLACGGVYAHAEHKLAEQTNETALRSQDLVLQDLAFDIPSQPLAAALSAYGAISGTQVLYESALAEGRNSTAINGTFTPEAALRALLAGTGLVGRRTDVDALTITPEPRERSAGATSGVPDARFLGALQAGILNVLCRNAETRPGDYRMALQLWITPTGALQHAALLGSTGNTRRDEALIAQLQHVQISVQPPPRLTQPITLAIVPRSPLQPPECSGR